MTRIVLLGAALLIATACSEGGTPVDNAACMLQRRLIADLGNEQDPVSVAVPYRVDVARLPHVGWIVVEDGRQVISYRPDGRFESLLARRGSGPLELVDPDRVEVDPTDSLWVSEKRGRVVVFDAEAKPRRMITNPDLLTVEGFTPSGLPFSIVNRHALRGRGAKKAIEVWTRTGDRVLHVVGPAAFDSLYSAGETAPLPTPPGSVGLSDTVFLAPGAWHVWVLRWTPHSEDSVVTGRAVWQALKLGDEPDRFAGFPVAVMSARDDALWILGAIRRISIKDEERLRRTEAALRKLEVRDPAIQLSGAIRNRVYDGVLLHVSADGTITSSLLFDEFPWGFASKEHYFTSMETDNGLIRLQIWQFDRVCA